MSRCTLLLVDTTLTLSSWLLVSLTAIQHQHSSTFNTSALLILLALKTHHGHFSICARFYKYLIHGCRVPPREEHSTSILSSTLTKTDPKAFLFLCWPFGHPDTISALRACGFGTVTFLVYPFNVGRFSVQDFCSFYNDCMANGMCRVEIPQCHVSDLREVESSVCEYIPILAYHF